MNPVNSPIKHQDQQEIKREENASKSQHALHLPALHSFQDSSTLAHRIRIDILDLLPVRTFAILVQDHRTFRIKGLDVVSLCPSTGYVRAADSGPIALEVARMASTLLVFIELELPTAVAGGRRRRGCWSYGAGYELSGHQSRES